jgi:hypothetical protein
MYSILLSIHSILRWIVLFTIVYTLYRNYKGWFSNSRYTKRDNLTRHSTATIVHIQFLIGFCLYSISPIVNYFLHHFKEAIHERDLRFFGMEHSLMMLTSVICVTIGSMASKRKISATEKFKTMAIWTSIGLFIILINVPWPFSPFTANRPYLRGF